MSTLLKVLEQGDFYKCSHCGEIHLTYTRFCKCDGEKTLEYNDPSGIYREFREQLIELAKKG